MSLCELTAYELVWDSVLHAHFFEYHLYLKLLLTQLEALRFIVHSTYFLDFEEVLRKLGL